MLPVLSRRSLQKLEKLAQEKYFLPTNILMENAAFQTTQHILALFGASKEHGYLNLGDPDHQQPSSTSSTQSSISSAYQTLHRRKILVCCGRGNNGGDGAAVARLCLNAGANVTLVYAGSLPQALVSEAGNLPASHDQQTNHATEQGTGAKKLGSALQNILAFWTLIRDHPHLGTFHSLADAQPPPPPSQIADTSIEIEESILVSLANQKWDVIVDAIYGIGYQARRQPQTHPRPLGEDPAYRLLSLLSSLRSPLRSSQRSPQRIRSRSSLNMCMNVSMRQEKAVGQKPEPPIVAADALILALDLPSGVMCDDPNPNPNPNIEEKVVQADQTICFGAFKPANVFSPASHLNGKCFLVPIGFPHFLIEQAAADYFVVEEEMVADFLRQTEPAQGSSKRDRGTVAIFAGSALYPGAALLAANSCFSAGAGLVTLTVPAIIREQISRQLMTEVILDSWLVKADGAGRSTKAHRLEQEEVADSEAGRGELLDRETLKSWLPNRLNQNDVLLIGCGLGLQAQAGQLLQQLLQKFEGLCILDADALNLMAPLDKPPWWRVGQPILLTPHLREFQRLLGKKITQQESLREAIAFAKQYQIFLLLKGENTLMVHPDGKVAILPFSVCSMGRAGSGDVLSGLIASFLGQMLARVKTTDAVSVSQKKWEKTEKKTDMLWRGIAAALYVAAKTANRLGNKVGHRFVRPDDIRFHLRETCAEILINNAGVPDSAAGQGR